MPFQRRKFMSSRCLTSVRQHFAVGASVFALLANLGTPMPAAAEEQPTAATPIQHVIVIIGENRSFDHVYATYQPASGQTVTNLLSKGIIDAEGKPGLNSKLAAQFNALDKTTYQISPAAKKGIHRSPESSPGADHGSTFQCHVSGSSGDRHRASGAAESVGR